MPAINRFAGQKIDMLETQHRRRKLVSIMPQADMTVMKDGKRLISFSNNDYLGLSRHPRVLAAAQDAMEKYGAGAGASRMVTGNHPLYAELEETLARIKHTEASCVFGSGYLANIGIITALMGESDLILGDKLSHACMIDGAKLSGASFHRFAHNDLAHCGALLEKYRSKHQKCLIMTERVFSMDGDCAPLAAFSTLAGEYDAWLLVDDAHGLGVLPSVKTGVDIWMGTLSKSAGAYGGYACATRDVVDYLITSARTLIYSTALPPSVVGAATAALQLMEQDRELCARPLKLARMFCRMLKLPQAQSSIVPVILGREEKALQAAQWLEEKGFLVIPIRPPTVRVGAARLRVTFSALHKEEQVRAFAEALKAGGFV